MNMNQRLLLHMSTIIKEKDVGRTYKLNDPIREAKLVGLLCNSFVLSRIKSIFGMEVLWGDSHQPHTSLLR